MYKVKLAGNYNVFVKDLNTEFTPDKDSKIFSDEEFESSEDIKIFLGDYLHHSKCDAKQHKETKTSIKPKNGVVELPKAKKNTETVVNATDSSKYTSAQANKKAEVKKDDTVVKADGASETSKKEEQKKLNTVALESEHKSDDSKKVETKTDKVVVKADKKETKISKESVKNNKNTAKKAGRPKKN